MLSPLHRRFGSCIALLVLLVVAWPGGASAGDLYLNGFRNPSIGPEYRVGNVSLHVGYYTTILSDEDDSGDDAQGFVRSGVTLWHGERWYASLSHLYGLDGPREKKHFAIAEVGVQFIVWSHVALRLGVAVIPAANGFDTKVNPTPGISLRLGGTARP